MALHSLDAAFLERSREKLLAGARGLILEINESSDLDDPSLAVASFDTIVCSLVLCSVDDVAATLRQIDGLLKPDGQLLALEHVRGTGLRGRWQDASTPVWRHLAAGCHANRDPIGAMRANGFAVTDCDRFMMSRAFPIVAPLISVVAIKKVRSANTDEGEHG